MYDQKGGRGSCRAAFFDKDSARQEPRPPALNCVRLPGIDCGPEAVHDEGRIL